MTEAEYMSVLRHHLVTGNKPKRPFDRIGSLNRQH